MSFIKIDANVEVAGAGRRQESVFVNADAITCFLPTLGSLYINGQSQPLQLTEGSARAFNGYLSAQSCPFSS